MKFYSDRAEFKGNINGKSVSNLKNMDFKIENKAERIKYAEKILKDCDELLMEYIDKYYKFDTKNELSDDINVFKNLELLATYILNSKDIPTESKQSYKIFTDEQLFIKASKENEGNYDNAMIFLKNNKRNEYIVKPLSIEPEDFEDERLKDILIPYKSMLDYVRSQLSLARKGEKIEMKNIKLAKKISKEIKDDMILTKEKILRPIQLPLNGDFTSRIDWDQFNYRNKEHVRAMLYINRSSIAPDDELSLIRYDMDVAIKHLRRKKKLDDKDMEILKMIRCDKSYTYEDIGCELEMSKQAVYSRINRIAKKIVKYFVEKNF